MGSSGWRRRSAARASRRSVGWDRPSRFRPRLGRRHHGAAGAFQITPAVVGDAPPARGKYAAAQSDVLARAYQGGNIGDIPLWCDEYCDAPGTSYPTHYWLWAILRGIGGEHCDQPVRDSLLHQLRPRVPARLLHRPRLALCRGRLRGRVLIKTAQDLQADVRPGPCGPRLQAGTEAASLRAMTTDRPSLLLSLSLSLSLPFLLLLTTAACDSDPPAPESGRASYRTPKRRPSVSSSSPPPAPLSSASL